MKEESLTEKQVPFLPRTLGEAIYAFEQDEFIKDILGDHIFKQYLEAKKKEWKQFCAAVTDWELNDYCLLYTSYQNKRGGNYEREGNDSGIRTGEGGKING